MQQWHNPKIAHLESIIRLSLHTHTTTTSHNTGTLSTPLDCIIFECTCIFLGHIRSINSKWVIFWIVPLLHSVSDTGSSFYLITIVFPFLSVHLYTPSHRLAVTSLFGGGGRQESVIVLLALAHLGGPFAFGGSSLPR